MKRKGLALASAAAAALVATSALVALARVDDPGPDPDRTAPSDGPLTAAPLHTGAERAFHEDSWWNTPLSADAPLDPRGDDYLHYLRTGPENGGGCLRLAGAGESHWGQPVYDSRPSDPSYDIEGLPDPFQLDELQRLRIPVGAQAAQNSDRSMSVYDRQKGYVVALSGAEYHADHDTWSATGATITYLDSNGLHVLTGRSDDPRNRGSHRGNNGATMAVELDEVRAGAVQHVLKVAAGPEVADRWVFPMINSDGDYHGSDPEVPPQGQRFRIKPSIDLEEMDLHPEALVIARALQRYGFYIGDSGGTTALKLQNTWADGRGQLWDVTADALCGMPFTPEYWDVIAGGYDPTRTGAGS